MKEAVCVCLEQGSEFTKDFLQHTNTQMAPCGVLGCFSPVKKPRIIQLREVVASASAGLCLFVLALNVRQSV